MMIPTRRHVVFAMVSTVLAGIGPLAQSTAGRVEVMVSVVTSREEAVDGLMANDFLVEIDGHPVTIDSAVQRAGPLAVIVMVDQSASMGALQTVSASASSYRGFTPPTTQAATFSLARLQEALLKGFLPALVPDDLARVGRITDTTTLSGVLQHTPAAVEAAIETLFTGMRSTSPMWDGVARAVDALHGETRRGLVILVTDGRTNANFLTVEDLAERAVNAHVVLSMIDEGQAELVKQDQATKAVIRPDRALRWLADATGGVYLPDAVMLGQTQPNPAALVERAIRGHRRAYTIGLSVPAEPRPRALKVAVKKAGVIVHAPAFMPAQAIR